ncbi:hypothetical protein [Mycobacterium attenuatum]|nr:hypothetical protein [Mycobacterium attenuatum]
MTKRGRPITELVLTVAERKTLTRWTQRRKSTQTMIRDSAVSATIQF